MQRTERCFLLTHAWRDMRGRFELTLFAKGESGRPVKVLIDDFRPLFFTPHDTPAELTASSSQRKPLPLRSMDGTAVDCLYFTTQAACVECARALRGRGVRVFESDVHPAERYLMERLVKGGFEAAGEAVDRPRCVEMRNPRIRGIEITPALAVLSLDIETNARTGEMYSIACAGTSSRVFIIGEESLGDGIVVCRDESELLRRSLGHIAAEDPDVLIGWNVVGFDLATMQTRCERLGVPFALGREGTARILRPDERSDRWVARVPGRVVLDGPVMLRAQFHTFDDYALDAVAAELLGKHKLVEARGREKIEEIDRLFARDKARLSEYNLQDAVLVREIFDATAILPNAVERSKRSGHLLDRVGGSVAAFDYLYLPLLHRAGRVARDLADVPMPDQPLTGGYVMESRPGLQQHVLLFDFKSLYPSIIRTFMIDPLGMASPSTDRVQGPVGPSFARDESILPAIIAELLSARAEAKRTRNDSLSQAIKILMNSFYGVLGSTGCRFFSYDLSSSITGIGQYILKKTVAHLEETTRHAVIYGDTDSLFLLLGPDHAPGEDVGRRIAAEATAWLRTELRRDFSVDSALELEFETHFRYFFMPALRGTQQGSKKRYCGAVERTDGTLELEFKGLESARSDWTELAREFQQELYLRVFTGQPVDDYVVRTVNAVKSGSADRKLIYRKRLNKRLDEYTGALPPHVQAARQMSDPRGVIAYVITKAGPQPAGKQTAPLDYQHYVDTQLQPIADAILEWAGTSFNRLVSGQQDLFGA